MERDCTSSRDRTGGDAEAVAIRHQTTSDFVLQWGNRKRLRCMKIQVKEKDDSSGAPVTRTTVRVDRRVVRPDKDLANQPSTTVNQTTSSDTAHDSKKGGTSSGSGEAAAGPPMVWPPKFVIALTNKEKEEDFMAIKGSKLPQRPKKRAKFIQRTLNLVSPGSWLCDLTLERYEVREKKISKKRPRGLKAMGNVVESDSE
ncbi:unnamed protein product [Malus baccata var. baccata]